MNTRLTADDLLALLAWWIDYQLDRPLATLAVTTAYLYLGLA